jgi:hypothetical protein
MNRLLNNFYSFVDSVKSSLFKEEKLVTPPVVSSVATPKENVDLPPSPVNLPSSIDIPCPNNLKCSSCPCNIPTDVIIKPIASKLNTTIKRIPTASSDLHEETPSLNNQLPLGEAPEAPVLQQLPAVEQPVPADEPVKEVPSEDFIKLATLPRL